MYYNTLLNTAGTPSQPATATPWRHNTGEAKTLPTVNTSASSSATTKPSNKPRTQQNNSTGTPGYNNNGKHGYYPYIMAPCPSISPTRKHSSTHKPATRVTAHCQSIYKTSCAAKHSTTQTEPYRGAHANQATTATAAQDGSPPHNR
ncbi:gp29 [Propionibacterium phage PA6]|uniref:Gp29 n=1 Tax=Propionibacterium phage PA6 TaxID=376758 RepID=A4K496_9CAUD|nr:gp29 [Propionibacterium phage PA6]ABE68598.1 gp29 [Propionibacterium phage PA6]